MKGTVLDGRRDIRDSSSIRIRGERYPEAHQRITVR